jgi:hypothetical protein
MDDDRHITRRIPDPQGFDPDNAQLVMQRMERAPQRPLWEALGPPAAP